MLPSILKSGPSPSGPHRASDVDGVSTTGGDLLHKPLFEAEKTMFDLLKSRFNRDRGINKLFLPATYWPPHAEPLVPPGRERRLVGKHHLGPVFPRP
ncbi:unnamed protein product [Ixodes persulcatus]